MKNGRISNNHSLLLRIRAYALLFCSPAFFFACSEVALSDSLLPETVQGKRIMEMIFNGGDLPDSVDLFVFNDDMLRRIESYQRLPVISGTVEALTGEGDKIAVAVANAPAGTFSERMPESYSALQAIRADLSLENGDRPMMSAQMNWSAHSSGRDEISLSRLGSEVFIRSLACDFSGTEYEGEMMTDVSVYLINVNGRCSVLGGDSEAPEEIVNSGHLEPSYLDGMLSPQMLYAELGSPIDKKGIRTDISLYCYPNESADATAGSPYTCLVIEGKICGRTWYYPIPVNRDEDGRGGVARNCRYVYDILIRRAGSSDPSIPVASGAVITGFAAGGWKENDKVTVGFSVGEAGLATPFASNSNPDEYKVHDLNIFLFNEDRKMEYKAYVPKPSYWYSDGLYKWEVPLLSGCRYTLYAVANVGFSLPCKSFNEFEAYRYYLSYPDDYKMGIPMLSTLEFVAEGFDEVIPSVLERMMAKICVSVDRSRLDRDVSFDVKKLFVRNCPRSVSLLGRSRVRTEDEVFSTGFLKEGDDLGPLNKDDGGGASGEVSLYLLENCQGDLLPGNEDYSKKILPEENEASSLCSYLEMYVSYRSSLWSTKEDEYLIYRSYLGDSPENFDVVRNTCSHFVIELRGDGLSGDGWRLDKSALVREPESLKLSYGEMQLTYKGESTVLKAYLHPEGKSDLVWSSSDNSVATVSSDGKVTAVGEGDCRIKCSLSGKPGIYDECEVNVKFGEFYMKVSPGTYIRGKPGETIDIRCDWYPPSASLDIGIDELEFDKGRGIYDYTPDPDGKGVSITLKKPGSGLIYMETGEPLNDAVLVIVEVDSVSSSS